MADMDDRDDRAKARENKMIIVNAPGADPKGRTWIAREAGMYLHHMDHHRLVATAQLVATSTYGLDPQKIVELARRIFELGHQLDGNNFRFGSLFQNTPATEGVSKEVFNRALTRNAQAVVTEWDEGVTIKDQDLSLVTAEVAMMLVNIAQEAAGKPQT